jgi:hypothetical protein
MTQTECIFISGDGHYSRVTRSMDFMSEHGDHDLAGSVDRFEFLEGFFAAIWRQFE